MRKKCLLVILAIAALGFVFVLNGGITTAADLGETLLQRFKEDVKPVAPLLPPDVKAQPGFEPGVGPVVGNIQMVQGEVLVFHKDQNAAYPLQKDHPIFNGDTLVSGERARLNAKLNDRSVFYLAPNSKLVVERSSFEPQTQTRSSTLSLIYGKARFIVTKIKGSPNYQIKTPTAVCGVRGSDLAIAVIPAEKKTSFIPKLLALVSPVTTAHAFSFSFVTIVVTGADTQVGFAGPVGPTKVVGEFSVTSAAEGAQATAPITVGPSAAKAALDSVGPGLAGISLSPTSE
jgi:hypothetical protein